MRLFRDEKGISPIVGVILVVAMTVMLAIIAWNYLGGMAQSTGKVYNIGVKVERYSNSTQPSLSDIVVTYVGGPDHDKVTNLTVTFIGCGNNNVTANPGFPWNGTNVKVGNTATCWIDANKKVHVIVTAKFSDGTEQVIYDKKI